MEIESFGEFSSLSESNQFEPLYHVPEGVGVNWGKIGRITLATAGVFGIIGFFADKKKRVTSIATPLGSIPEVGMLETETTEPFPRCSEREKEKVQEIFKTVAEGEFSSPWRAKGPNEGPNLLYHGVWMKLIKLGNDIDHIHPFAFLSSPSKNHVRAIFDGESDFKIGKVIGGIKKGMEREGKKLYRYIPNFAAEMGKDPQPIKPLIQARDWIGLVNYLFDTNAAHEG